MSELLASFPTRKDVLTEFHFLDTNLFAVSILTGVKDALFPTEVSLISQLFLPLISLNNRVKEHFPGEIRDWPLPATNVIVLVHVGTILTKIHSLIDSN